MIYINGQPIVKEYFSNTEVRITEISALLNQYSLEAKVELKYETENKDYKVNDDLMILYFVKKELDRINYEAELVLWSMPYQRMDHKNEGYLQTLPYAAEFIKSLEFKSIKVIEPHSEMTELLLSGTKHTTLYPVINWALEVIEDFTTPNTEIVIAFPDRGAYERYGESFQNNNFCVFRKQRDGVSNQIIHHAIEIGNIPVGATCIILDDICSTGKTLLDVAYYAKMAGAKKVFVVVGHCENIALERGVVSDDSPIDLLFTSKSMINCKHEKIRYMNIPEGRV